ncbi:MAG: hypothetical protein ACK44Y_13595, partial [Novosphingobium sp.]
MRHIDRQVIDQGLPTGQDRRLARAELSEAPVLASWQTLIDYLTIDMAHLTHERVRVLYLD